MTGRPGAVSGLLMLVVTVMACGGGSTLAELQTVKSGMLDVVLLTPHDALRHGKDDFVIEFRNASDRKLADVGEVRATASMPMSGAPMFGSISVQKTDVPGRYRASGEFSMAGTWRLAIEWDGPSGKGSVAFSASVQ